MAAGVVVGAIVDTDCASVSIGERTSRRNPHPDLTVWDTVVSFLPCGAGTSPSPTAAGGR